MIILIKFRWRFIDFVNYIIYFSWQNLSENHANRISRNKILRFIQEHETRSRVIFDKGTNSWFLSLVEFVPLTRRNAELFPSIFKTKRIS